MGTFLSSSDLPAGTGDALGLTADQMIQDAEGLALLSAPCLGDDPLTLTPIQQAAVVAVLRGAIMRWNDVGSGARQSVTTGPFSETTDTTVARRGMYWPSEITSLQSICSDGESGKAFSVDTVSFDGVHADACSINFGAAYCSCGADIAGFPLWGV
jgi:hypothetical protein